YRCRKCSTGSILALNYLAGGDSDNSAGEM
ncbi:uncharacterized protein METZ01_LOCUS463483, partial [marine metagenome]